MKNFNYILFGLALLTWSCGEDFVDLTNPNAQTTGTFWKTGDDALMGINAVYSTLYYDGMYMRLYPWIMDVRADDMRNTSPWWITAVSVYQVTPDNPCYLTVWEACYKGVWRANQVLDNVPGIDMDNAQKERILAEAKFLRALFYYHLVIVYKNIPLILSTPQSSADYYPSQATEDVVWNQIVKDFSEAMEVLPRKEDYKAADLGRATKGAAAGYLAKSLMIMHEFDQAAPVLKGIIDQNYGSYQLIENYRENFTTTNENNSESLFEVQFLLNEGSTLGWTGEPGTDWSKTSGKARTYAPLGFGWGDITPTDWIYNEFLLEKTIDGENDPRMDASLFYEHPGDTTYTVYGNSWEDVNLTNICYVRKYLNDETLADETAWRSEINERILRYDDILLLYAECLNELGQTSEAYSYIQQVRDRANLPVLATAKPGLTQDGMRDQIAHERALEFCFEAQRYVDILRWDWFDDANKRAIMIEHDPEIANWTFGREIMALPPNEIDANKNLIQNPGWSN